MKSVQKKKRHTTEKMYTKQTYANKKYTYTNAKYTNEN